MNNVFGCETRPGMDSWGFPRSTSSSKIRDVLSSRLVANVNTRMAYLRGLTLEYGCPAHSEAK